MRPAIIFSAILHILLVIVVLFGLPSFFEKKIIQNSAVVVEILPIGEFTNVKPKKKATPKPKPVSKPTSKAKIKPALPDPTIRPEPEIKISEPAPLPPKIVKKPKPEPKVIKKVVKPIDKPTPPKKQEEKIVKKKEEKKIDFGAVLNTIEEIESKQPDKKPEDNMDFSDIEDMLAGSDDQPDYKPGLPLSISEKDAIRRQIMQNWSTSMISGAKDSHKMTVTLQIYLASDGTVTDVEKKNVMRYNSDPIYRAMVDSAVRAVHKSSPLKDLPAEKYAVKDGWREMEINFDPSQMMY